VGRFTGVDPISDQFAHLSTYNYASNDPILNIDLWGLQGVPYSVPFNDGNTITILPDYYEGQWIDFFEPVDAMPLLETIAGFTPAGAYIDGANIANDLRKGDFIGAGVSSVFLLPGADIFKGAKTSMKNGLREFISTEPGMQSTKTIDYFTEKFKNAETQEQFNQIFEKGGGPAKVIENPIDGKIYVIDGHHKLTSAEKAGTEFTVPVEKVNLDDTIFESYQDVIDSSNNKDFIE